MTIEPELIQVERRPEQVCTPGPVLEGVRRIVVVRRDKLGDLLLALPAVEAIRRTYPQAKLAMMVSPALVPLARMVEGLDAVLPASGERGALHRAFVDFQADLAICLSGGAGPPWAARRAGVAHRVGSARRWYSFLFNRRVRQHRRSADRHEVEYDLSYAHIVGATAGEARFALDVPQSARQAIAGWLSSRRVAEPFVLLHPGSGGSCPRWPAAHFAALAGRLRSRGRSVVLSIGPEERDLAEVLDASVEARELPRFDGALPELAALLSRARVAVTNSTGPAHLAAALGSSTLALHAPWATCGVRRWGPYSSNGWGLVARHADASHWSRSRRRALASELMQAIQPDLVLRCTERMLDGSPPGSEP